MKRVTVICISKLKEHLCDTRNRQMWHEIQTMMMITWLFQTYSTTSLLTLHQTCRQREELVLSNQQPAWVNCCQLPWRMSSASATDTCIVPRYLKIQLLYQWQRGLNDYRPVALTSIVMKSFERLTSTHPACLHHCIHTSLPPQRTPYSLPYTQYSPVWKIKLHIPEVCIDFSSVFNVIILQRLIEELPLPCLNTATCCWVVDFPAESRLT